MHEREKCKRGGERDRSMRERWAGGWCGVCECVYVAFWHFSGETVHTFQKILKRICKPQNTEGVCSCSQPDFSPQQREEVGLGTGTHTLRYRKP